MNTSVYSYLCGTKASFNSLAVELVLEVLKAMPDFETLENSIDASDHAASVFNNTRMHKEIMVSIATTLVGHPAVHGPALRLARLQGLMQNTLFIDNPLLGGQPHAILLYSEDTAIESPGGLETRFLVENANTVARWEIQFSRE